MVERGRGKGGGGGGVWVGMGSLAAMANRFRGRL